MPKTVMQRSGHLTAGAALFRPQTSHWISSSDAARRKPGGKQPCAAQNNTGDSKRPRVEAIHGVELAPYDMRDGACAADTNDICLQHPLQQS